MNSNGSWVMNRSTLSLRSPLRSTKISTMIYDMMRQNWYHFINPRQIHPVYAIGLYPTHQMCNILADWVARWQTLSINSILKSMWRETSFMSLLRGTSSISRNSSWGVSTHHMPKYLLTTMPLLRLWFSRRKPICCPFHKLTGRILHQISCCWWRN